MAVQISLLFAVSIATAAYSASVQEVPDNMKSVIQMTQSFGLGSYPISFWNYTNLKAHCEHMDESEVEDWADAGFTVPLSPGYDPKDPEQKAHILRLLDWAHERGMTLILCDPRC